MVRDSLPWAAPFLSLPAGTVLSPSQAHGAFGPVFFDEDATYASDGSGWARRVIDEPVADANGLPRKLRRNGTPECYQCRREYKRRARQRAYEFER